jgi:phage RecT family recombinase
MTKFDIIEDAIKSVGVEPIYERLALLALEKNPKLARCTPESWADGILLSQRLRLPIDNISGLHTSIEKDPDTNENGLGLVPGYQAFVELLVREGSVSYVEAHEVRERDVFKLGRGFGSWAPLRGVTAALGLDNAVLHLEVRKNRGPVVAVYAIAHFHDGRTKLEVLRRQDIEDVDASDDADPDSARNWKTRVGVEVLKALVIKRVCKTLARSAELHSAIYLARMAERCKTRPTVREALRMLGVPSSTAPLVEAPERALEGGERRCCYCGNVFASLVAVKVNPQVWSPSRCQACDARGIQHEFCGEHVAEYQRARLEFEAKAAQDSRELAALKRSKKTKAKTKNPSSPEGSRTQTREPSGHSETVVVSPASQGDGEGSGVSPELVPTPAPEASSEGTADEASCEGKLRVRHEDETAETIVPLRGAEGAAGGVEQPSPASEGASRWASSEAAPPAADSSHLDPTPTPAYGTTTTARKKRDPEKEALVSEALNDAPRAAW